MWQDVDNVCLWHKMICTGLAWKWMKTAISMSYIVVSQDVGYNHYVKWIIGLDYLKMNENSC